MKKKLIIVISIISIIGIIFIALFINLIGCSNITKVNKLSTLEKQVEFFNQHSDDFEAVTKTFMSNDDLRTIASSASLLNPEENEIIKKYDGVVFQSTTQFSENEYKEYAANVKNIISIEKMESVARSDDYVSFFYTGTMGKTIGWMYSKSGTEPNQKEFYIIKLQKINDNWYACVWS